MTLDQFVLYTTFFLVVILVLNEAGVLKLG